MTDINYFKGAAMAYIHPGAYLIGLGVSAVYLAKTYKYEVVCAAK